METNRIRDYIAAFSKRELPKLIKRDLMVVGAVIFVSSIFQMFLDVPVGFLLDKYGYKKMLMVGTQRILRRLTFSHGKEDMHLYRVYKK